MPGRDVQINLHAALVERNVPRSSSSGDRFVDRVRNIETGGFVEFSMMEGISSGAAADVSVLLCQKRPDRERPEITKFNFFHRTRSIPRLLPLQAPIHTVLCTYYCFCRHKLQTRYPLRVDFAHLSHFAHPGQAQ